MFTEFIFVCYVWFALLLVFGWILCLDFVYCSVGSTLCELSWVRLSLVGRHMGLLLFANLLLGLWQFALCRKKWFICCSFVLLFESHSSVAEIMAGFCMPLRPSPPPPHVINEKALLPHKKIQKFGIFSFTESTKPWDWSGDVEWLEVKLCSDM